MAYLIYRGKRNEKRKDKIDYHNATETKAGEIGIKRTHESQES